MRRLHPPGPAERLEAEGKTEGPQGTELWTVHAGPAERRILRVDTPGAMWHCVLDENGCPERVQVRVGGGSGAIDATFTFFENEVLVWRKGAEPASETIPVTQGIGLTWSPVACRGLLRSARGGGGHDVLAIRLAVEGQGGVTASLERADTETDE